MPSTPAMTSPITTSYWCYSCTRFVSVWAEPDRTAGVSCPHCDGGFIEELSDSSTTAELATPASTEIRSVINNRRSVIRRRRSDRRPSFNPVIVLQGGAGERDESEEGDGARDRRAFEFYYDDGSGSGLRSLPDSVSEILMGSGFERLLEQLSQIEASTGGISRYGNPPASKSAIESLPRVEISDCHLGAEANCAVCTEVFEPETEAREMPCKHIFHGDCIVPWLSIRNSCPVCRFELPSEPNRLNNEEEHAVGMTIWRLPGGGFAVGRFNAAMRNRERVLPVVLTEMDGGGFGNSDGHGPRRISWVRSHETLETDGNSTTSGTSSGGRLRRMVRGMVSFMRRARPNRNSSSSSSPISSPNHMDLNTGVESRVLNRSNSVLRRYFRRNRSNRDSVLH